MNAPDHPDTLLASMQRQIGVAMNADTQAVVSEQLREADDKANTRPSGRELHNRLVREAKQLAALAIQLAVAFEKLPVPPEPDVYYAHGQIGWLLDAYSDYARCLFNSARPIMERIADNAADYGGARIESYDTVEGGVTIFLGPIIKAAEEMREPVEP